MRSMYPDSEYFAFIGDARGRRAVEHFAIPAELTLEFPGLRIEEAKAVLADWRSSRRTVVDKSPETGFNA